MKGDYIRARRKDMATAWNAACAAGGVTDEDRRTKSGRFLWVHDLVEDNFYYNNATWWMLNEATDIPWFNATCRHGYPEFDGWEPEVS